MSKNRRHNQWGTHSGSATAKHGRSGPGKRSATIQERRRPQNCPCCCAVECMCDKKDRRPTVQEERQQKEIGEG